MKSLLESRPFFLLLSLLGAFIVFSIWVWGEELPLTSVNGDERSRLTDLVYGRAWNPFVQRALVPAMTRAAMSALPADTDRQLEDFVGRHANWQREVRRMGLDEQFLGEHLVAFFFSFLALALFPYAVRALVSSLYATEPWVASALSLGSLAFLPPFFLVGTHYIYDFPALLFFTLGIALLIRRRWAPFYVVFLLGCVNKETMVLLTAGFLLLSYGRMRLHELGAHVALQLLLFGAVKTLLAVRFAANPGALFEFHLFRNLQFLLLPYALSGILLACILGFLFLHDLGAKPPALKRTAWLIVPFAGLTFLFGYIDEIRDMYEVFPLLFLMMAHTVVFTFMNVPFKVAPLSDRRPGPLPQAS